MPISSVAQIKFCNERVRVSADLLARAYNRAKDVATRWTALGGGQAAINQMPELRVAAQKFAELYEWCFRTEKLWFLLGANTFIPNDSSQVWDNATRTAQDSARPAYTGVMVTSVIDRVVQFQNWLLSSTGSFTDTARNSTSYYNTILAASQEAVAAISVSDAGNFINRCNELTSNYEAGTNANLNSLLAVAVNPTYVTGN